MDLDKKIRQLLRVESLMPKGVEHFQPSAKVIADSVSVESLMPKGVEHKKD